jgi:hypothetical protein
MRESSVDEKEALAIAAGTTVGYLRQAAGGYREYSMKAGLAQRIEIAAGKLRERNPALPELKQTDLCADCSACKYAHPEE